VTFPLIKSLRKYWGYDQYSAETFDRLIHSQHVKDLRWIAQVTLYAAVAAIAIIVTIQLEFRIPAKTTVKAAASAAAQAATETDTKLLEILVPFQISAVLAGLGAVIAWCYQTGSGRLGTVDLFACEITTLCRIWNVNDVIEHCIEAYKFDENGAPTIDPDKIEAARTRFKRFDSLEGYTPVFDLNAKELRNLDVKVLTNVTAFYTYWKATRDAYRRLASVSAAWDEKAHDETPKAWDRAMRNVIYMHFLACESARKAVRDLIEFEPSSVENIITILLSELSAYRFLKGAYGARDVRRERLKLRLDRYPVVVQRIRDRAESGPGDIAKMAKYPSYGARDERLEELSRDWDKALKMLPDLRCKYLQATGHDLPQATPGAAS
jgi:hypothetical protein